VDIGGITVQDALSGGARAEKVRPITYEKLSPDAFAVEQGSAGIKTELGPMSETELWAYLNSRTLIDIIPSPVLTFLNVCNALDMDMVLSVVRPPVADPQLASS
jgi:hypothetical protein